MGKISTKKMLSVSCLFMTVVALMLSSCTEKSISTNEVEKKVEPMVSTMSVPANCVAILHESVPLESRATSYVDQWSFVDVNGNKSEMIIKDSNGRESGIEIGEIAPLGDKYMMFVLDMRSVERVLGFEPGASDEILSYCSSHSFLLDKKTGKTYVMTNVPLPHRYYKGKDGYIYFSPYMPYVDAPVYRFDENAKTVTNIMPDNQNYCEWYLSDDGIIGYFRDVMRPTGGEYTIPYGPMFILDPANSLITPTDEFGFAYHGGLYTVKLSYDPDLTFSRWTLKGGNVSKNAVCNIDMPDFLSKPIINSGHMRAVYNSAKDVMMILSFTFMEFDGKTVRHVDGVELDEPTVMGETVASDAFYWLEGATVHKIDFADYEKSDINLSGYQIDRINVEPNREGFTFRGLRYSDSAKVACVVDSNGKVTVLSESQFEAPEIKLIPLN